MTAAESFKARTISIFQHLCYYEQLQEVRALRGYFGPPESQKLKVAFHQFHLIGLLEE